MQQRPFTSIVHNALAATPINNLLEKSKAVILERIAMGAGATNWYYSNRSQLEAIEAQLSPGSAVSFYFDNRIQNVLYSPELKPELEKIITQEREVVFGVLREDHLHIDVEFVGGPRHLAEITDVLDSSITVFYGAFPARDNDGVRAVTIVLPDADGVVRRHPH